MTDEARCQVRLPGFPGESVVCGRLRSDPCTYCLAYDRNKEDWAKVFGVFFGPRKAVEGDI